MANHSSHKSASTEGTLSVEHFPNPTDLHSVPTPPKTSRPYMWFYRTQVTNTWDKPLKIVEFEYYFWANNRWLSSNILRRPLTTEVFLRWYQVRNGTQDGWLQPGCQAVCDINWHGGDSPHSPKGKWVFYAVDEEGNLHQGEGEIISSPT